MKKIKSTDKDYVELTGELRFETTKAYLFHDGTIENWVPKSQVESYEIEGSVMTIIIPEWLAKDKGFI